MLTITTEKQTICINTKLLKSRFKSAIITLLKVSTFILAFAGILIIIGTEGASKTTTNVSIFQIATNCLKGFLCCGIAWVLNFIKLVIE